MREAIEQAADAIRGAEALLVGAGAGMGVDSGLPDFRGDQGFWKAYPPFAALCLSFVDLANPTWFDRDPQLAWGFYGHRLQLYRRTDPHDGFAILRRWAGQRDHGAFVFTSNVDGQFQRAAFSPDRLVECHGSIHYLQCSRPCSSSTWDASGYLPDIDDATCRANPPLPHCPACGAVARPNILMFGDGTWNEQRTADQQRALRRWLHDLNDRSLVVIECGAGTAVPTVRWTCERMAAQLGATLIRINPREPEAPAGSVALRCGAKSALHLIDEALRSS